MTRSLLIDDGLFETRAALMRDDQLEELHIERPDEISRVGDFYLGRVAKVMDDLDAAFVDIEKNETGFLQARDIARKNDGIGSLVHEGQKLLVQVIKDPLEEKGVQLGCHFQIESANLLYQPNGQKIAISKHIASKEDKDRLVTVLEPKLVSGGLIVRTSALTVSKNILDAEISRLQKIWDDIKTREGESQTPRRLSPHQTPLDRILSDLLQPGMEVRVTTSVALTNVVSFAKKHFRDEETKVSLWKGSSSLFEESGIDAQIETALDKRIDLESGVSITLEPTEAMVVIDVNFVGNSPVHGRESVALKSNMVAASQIARQIRLRNYSGIIIVDFIQMSGPGDAKRLQQHMEKLLQQDPVRTRMIGLTELGLMQITRQRSKRALHSLMKAPCPICQGAGCQDSPTSAMASLLRSLESHTRHTAGSEIEIVVGLKLAEQMALSQSRMENHLGRRLSIYEDADLPYLAFSIK